MSEELIEDLTCTICNELKETYSEIVYSRGSKVCVECKKEYQSLDNRLFDMDVTTHRPKIWCRDK